MERGRIGGNEWERHFYELALKCFGGGAGGTLVRTSDGGGYIYSFNGPQSLFVDTIRSLRALAVGHRLGHALMGENDRQISCLSGMIQHAQATASYSVYYGEGRDIYDVRGRVAHESIFNPNDGNYRCPNTQQGYSPFTTWTRGLAWAMCGFAEQLEFLEHVRRRASWCPTADAAAVEDRCFGRRPKQPAIFTSRTPRLMAYRTGTPARPACTSSANGENASSEPFNAFEPVDSSAAAIAAQGLLRLGRHLKNDRYWQAGLTVCSTLFEEPYLSADPGHEGLLLHSVYHRPNGWDFIPEGHTDSMRRSQSCGAIITRANWRCICYELARTNLI